MPEHSAAFAGWEAQRATGADYTRIRRIFVVVALISSALATVALVPRSPGADARRTAFEAR